MLRTCRHAASSCDAACCDESSAVTWTSSRKMSGSYTTRTASPSSPLNSPRTFSSTSPIRVNWRHLRSVLQQPVGIDIEQLRTPPVADGLKSYSLTPRELEHFERAAEPERSLRFFRAWTRREAIVKAEGVGLQRLSGQLELEDLVDHLEPAWEEGGIHCKRGFSPLPSGLA